MPAMSDSDAMLPSAKSCPQCGAGMDAAETVCPQCGHGLKEYAERKRRAEIERRENSPTICLPDLPSPAARRRYLRAKILNKAIAPTWFPHWLARFLLLGHIHPEPPLVRQVAARALVLAAVAARGDLERQHDQSAWHLPLAWLKGVGGAAALEAQERAFLKSAAGQAEEMVIAAASWRREGLAVLAWALK
jgi:predicted amidophosphoribosyltransferase